MQAFVRPVLLRRRGVNALVLNAEPHPPDVEGREPAERLGHEGRAVVAPHGQRQPVLAKRVREYRPHVGPVPLSERDDRWIAQPLGTDGEFLQGGDGGGLGGSAVYRAERPGKTVVMASGNPTSPSTSATRMSSTPRLLSSVITRSQNPAPSVCSIQRPMTSLWPSRSTPKARQTALFRTTPEPRIFTRRHRRSPLGTLAGAAAAAMP